MIHNYEASYDNVRIRPLKESDIENLRIWRNNVVQTRFLRQIGEITPDMQLNWYKNYLKDNNQIIFTIEETKKLHRMVGSLALYDFHDNMAEIGKIQIGDPEAHGLGIGKKSLVMALKIGFDEIKLKRIYASVHQDNIAARTNDLKIGFKIVGQHPSEVGGYEDEIEIYRDDLYAVNSYCSEIVITK